MRSKFNIACYFGNLPLIEYSLLRIGGEPGQNGIYLHILWIKNNPDHFYLYIGQSTQMKERLRCHQDPNYRRKNPTLHYYVWDLGLMDKEYEIEDKFVFLSTFQKEVDSLLLNLLEMWCCLILQTITKNALLAYIPKGMVAPYAGMHLNVALPIHQSLQGDAVFDTLHGDPYHSNDPLVQRYYSSLRRRFYELKYSPNPLLREYYCRTRRDAQTKASVTRRAKAAQAVLQGKEVPVYVYPTAEQFFSISHFTFSISRK